MMSLWDALRMNMMISYQELVRTFPSTARPIPAIIPKISNRFRNDHDKTHLTRADAESRPGQQQESGESAAHGKEITRSGA
ncbi:hypothetical protein DN586_06750 [Enterobacter cloacae]|nr:hypothetical protein DN586_06750 [Enterobacter cloacae]